MRYKNPEIQSGFHWFALLKPGDILVSILGIGFCVYAVWVLWSDGRPDQAVIRAGGEIYAKLQLSNARLIDVPGPLGVTRIEILPGRARIVSDPGPRQYCVLQGWLTRAGSVAICVPNQVSLMLTGRQVEYDSLNY